MMLNKEHNKKVVNLTRARVAGDFKRQSLRNALHITVSGDRDKAAIWHVDECQVASQTIRLQAILARMSCNERTGVRRRGSNQGVQEPRPQPRIAGSRPQRPRGGRRVCGHAVIDLAGAEGGKGLDDDDDEDEQLRPPSVPSWPTTRNRAATGKAESPLPGLEEEGRVGPATILWGVHRGISSGLPRLLRAELPFPT